MAALQDGKELAVGATLLGDVTVSFNATIAVGASNRHISVALAGVQPGDTLSVRPTSGYPDGYSIGAAYCVTAGTLVVPVSHPALVLNASFSIQARVFRVMTN